MKREKVNQLSSRFTLHVSRLKASVPIHYECIHYERWTASNSSFNNVWQAEQKSVSPGPCPSST